MNFDERVLILASTRKDAESTERLLRTAPDAAFEPHVCDGFDSLLHEIDRGAGVVIVAKEILVASNLDVFKAKLASQPSWSDIPVVVLVSSGDLVRGRSPVIAMLKTLRNTTILERPVRVATLISILISTLSDRRRQYEVRNLLDQLERSKDEAERASRAKSEFLANMSHEIRTPLGAVLGFSELAAEHGLSEEDRDSYAQAVRRNGELLLALVNDILDLSKVEAGKVEFEDIEVSIPEIMSEVVTAVQQRAHAKGIKLAVNYETEIPDAIRGDPMRIKQILINVVGNAVKFTDRGAVALNISSRTGDGSKVTLVVDVADSGLGIDPSQQPKLFQPFVQADSSTTRAYGGTGLGLVLSRQLARSMGGDLELVDSKVGEGSVFRITLKTTVVSYSAVNRRIGADSPDYSEIVGMRVLLVEDSPDNQLLIGRVLSRVGVQIEVANDGLEGVEKTLDGDFDIVLMDVQMPRLDGNQATARLRKLGYSKPIIALTAHALKGDRDRAIEAGFDDYLTKPIQRPLLVGALKKFKGMKRPLRSVVL